MQEAAKVSWPVQAVLNVGSPSSVVKMEEWHPGDPVPEEDQRGTEKPSFIIPAESSEELRRCMASHQTRNECQAVPRHWKVQWQDVVAPDLTSSSIPAWNNLQVPQLTLEDDIEVYLSTFERVADICQWPREQWVNRLVPALCGAAQQAYSSLGSQDQQDYGKVKAAILYCCDVGSEARRQRFRHFCFWQAAGPHHACRCLRQLCCRWLKPEIRTKEQILELLILEQFLNILPEEMKAWVWECRPETCAQAVALAEEFVLRQEESEKSDCHVTVLQEVEDVTLKEEKPFSDVLWDVPGSQSHPQCLLQESVGWREPLEPQHELTSVPREEAQPLQEIAGSRTASQATDHPSAEDAGDLKRPMSTEARRPGERGGSSKDELSAQRRGLRKGLVSLPSHIAQAKAVLVDPKDTESQVRTFFCGEKPYQCQECGESFRVKQELALHKGTHHRDRPFPCAICGKRFTRLYHLTTHLRIHSDVLFATHWCLNKCVDGDSDLELCSLNGELPAPEILLNETSVHEGDWISVRCIYRGFLLVTKYFICKDGHPIKSIPATLSSTAAYALHVSKESVGLYTCGYEIRESNNQGKKSALSVPQKLLVLPRNPDPTNRTLSISVTARIAGFAILILAPLIYFLTRKVVSRWRSSRQEADKSSKAPEEAPDKNKRNTASEGQFQSSIISEYRKNNICTPCSTEQEVWPPICTCFTCLKYTI